MEAKEMVLKMAEILDKKGALDIQILGVAHLTSITDYFVIATATSSTHLKALCDEVEYKLKEEDEISASRVEGYQGGGWILVDFDDVIVHIFDANSREFFNLEKLWAAAERIEFEAKED